MQDSRAFLIVTLLTLVSISHVARADFVPPQPLPLQTSIEAPQDIPYPGVIRLEVDATDISRHIFKVHETIPVSGGESLTLLYPQWLPANHSPTGRVDQIAGLIIQSDGQRIEWKRDSVNVFAFQ